MGQTTSCNSVADPEKLSFEEGPPSKKRRCPPTLPYLPRELRDQIYHYAWEGTYIRFYNKGWAIDARYPTATGDCENNPTKLPGWLLLDKGTVAEGTEQFYTRAEFSIDSKWLTEHFVISRSSLLFTEGDAAIPLSSKRCQSGLLTVTKARIMTFFAINAYYKFDHVTYLDLKDEPPESFEPVGFLFSEIHRDLISLLSICNDLRHLRFVFVWEPIPHDFAKSKNLEDKSKTDMASIASLFGGVRTVEIFVALGMRWFPLHRPCSRAVTEFDEELLCVMAMSQRPPKEVHTRLGNSVVFPQGTYWERKWSEEAFNECHFTFSQKYIFDDEETSRTSQSPEVDATNFWPKRY